MMSCEDAGTTSTPGPRFRVSNQSGTTRCFNIGIHDTSNNTAELAATWVSVSNESVSDYQSVPVGSYRVYRDEDTDHNSFNYLKYRTRLLGASCPMLLIYSCLSGDYSHEQVGSPKALPGRSWGP